MVRIEQIRKAYGEKIVLNGVSFEVKEGTIYGLIGHNGAGKTTLMSIIAGLSKADSGICRLDGEKLNYLPDVPCFFDYMKCGEYIDFLIGGLNEKPKRSRRELLSIVGLDEKIKVGSMSRGMKQRLGIASVLVNDPDVLLLDEPTSALDPSGRMELLEILKNLRDTGKKIILSTHILADMEKVCDEVGFLHNGIIVKQVKISDLSKKNIWKISFEDKCELLVSTDTYKIKKCDEYTVSVEFDKANKAVGQKDIMIKLADMNNPITSIRNESEDLDGMFQEVTET